MSIIPIIVGKYRNKFGRTIFIGFKERTKYYSNLLYRHYENSSRQEVLSGVNYLLDNYTGFFKIVLLTKKALSQNQQLKLNSISAISLTDRFRFCFISMKVNESSFSLQTIQELAARIKTNEFSIKSIYMAIFISL